MTEHNASVPTSAASTLPRPRCQPAIVIFGTALSLGTLSFGLIACNGDDTPGEASTAAFSNQSSAVSSSSASAGAGASASAMESTNPSPGGNQGGSPQSDAGSAATATLQAVSPESFRRGSSLYEFKAAWGGNKVVVCGANDSGTTCSGKADPSVPGVSGEAFHESRPNGITLNSQGLRYTVFEVLSPSQPALETGQQVTIGAVTCAKPADQVLRCSSGSNSFTISGPERTINTIGLVSRA
ncbi:hypothetical protein [Corynebacterium heidelbergense]|uniref:Uncharacterized protein n=1 Tax=Corynebacterium heidelbergense TaxID=2055947 RepID=A0A364VBV5_9CORY|nr:hypothetical protein [Corynebacterium heidelbergense]RAV34046.1 hypothetical protein CWC39_05225 [Corynebacterium heidelbergense]WCZ35630.1 hypothetical protein CHEID_00240 [Corynebacterium heidelbergense]